MSTDMKYIHPHSESRIIDNAVLTVSASGLSNKFIALEAEKGMPNEATYISSPSEYTFNFGEPNYNKYGQSGLNAIQWLRAGGGLWVIRVVPDDETFAGLSIGIGYRANSEYANDEPEFKRLERTEKQIEVWNADHPDGGSTVFTKGKASGNSTLLPKFYPARKKGKVWEPDLSIGMMTEDEIAIINSGLASGVEKYTPKGLRRVPMVGNDTIRIKWEAVVGHPVSIDVNGVTKFYYILNANRGEFSTVRYYESSSLSEKVTYNGLEYDAVPMKSSSDEAKILVDGYFVLSPNSTEAVETPNTIPDLIAAYIADVKFSQSRSGNVDTSSESWADRKYINRLEALELNTSGWIADGKCNGGCHTADFLSEIKKDVEGLTDDCLKAFITGGSASVWEESYEVYHFDPIEYGNPDPEGSARPISEKEMKTIGSNYKVSQPALSQREFEDWLFANDLDAYLYATGGQFGEGVGADGLETDNGELLATNENEVLATETEDSTLHFTATNPEVVVDRDSTGYYSLQKLYYVNNQEGEALYSRTTTAPEAAIYNNKNAGSRVSKVMPDFEVNQKQYVYGSSATFTKNVVDYTMTSKVEKLDDVKVDGMGDVADSENKIAVELLGFFKEVGGKGFMKFKLDDDNNTLVSFKLDAGTAGALNKDVGYLTNAEYDDLTDELKVLFVEESVIDTESGKHGKFVLDPRPIDAGDFPRAFTDTLGRYSDLADLESADGLYIGDNGDYVLNKDKIGDWLITLKVNSYLNQMLVSETNSMEGDGGGDTVLDVNFAPYKKVAFIDSDGYWGIQMSYCATSLDNEFFTMMANQEDPDHPVTLKGKSTGEYAFYKELYTDTAYIVNGKELPKGNNEPNPDYAHAVYDAIGLVATPYSVFELQAEDYLPDDPDVVEQRANSVRGRVVGSTLDNIVTQNIADLRVPSASYAEFIRFLPKGSGKWYNRLSVNLAYDDAMDRTYTEWSMFRLTISEKVDGGEISREAFNVSFDPDAVSAAKESLFIEDVVNRFSKYLTCKVNYDNLANFIDAKLGIRNSENKPVEDEDGNEIVIPVDAVIKLIYNQITLDDFNVRIFGEGYESTDLAQYKIKSLMSAIGYDDNLCHLDTTLFDSDGNQFFVEPFVSLYLFQTLASTNSLYLNGGSYGRGWGYEHENDEGELITNSTLEQALVRAYNGTTDAIITNINLCVFDMVMDCNYPVMVKTAMSDLSSVIRQDCVTILDQGISTANAQQAIDMRKNQMNYDTFYTSIFTQHLEITDEWSGRPVKVTPTFFLASKIPLNDTAYSPAVNFVGPNRGVVSGFNSVSWIPTEPEKDQLYRNQVNYIERDNIATLFATELTTQTKNTPLTLIHAVRTLLRLRRSMVAVSRTYRSEFATSDVYGLLQTELNEIASSYVLAGGYEYITPVINTSDYDRQQRICRVDVDVAFTDIIERFAFNFIVNRV